MFKKYSIDDLFLAQILVTYPQFVRNKDGSSSKINSFDGNIHNYGYSYRTIIWKDKDKYVDLAHRSILINKIDAYNTSYVISRLVPLSKYYTDGTSFSRIKALRIGKKYKGKL